MSVTNQERGRVEGGQRHRMKNLRLFQGVQLSIPQETDTPQENLLPGVKLEYLYATQDLIHQFDPTVHKVHLNLLTNKQKEDIRMKQHVPWAVEVPELTWSLLLTLAMNPLRGKITTTVAIPASADGPRSYQSVKLEPSVTCTTASHWCQWLLWSLTSVILLVTTGIAGPFRG